MKFNSSIIYAMILSVQAMENKKGTFFSAINETKKGPRSWTCRLGVQKYVKGTGAPYNAEEKNFITVWDPNASGPVEKKYRQLDISTLQYLSVCGRVLVKGGAPTKEYNKLLDDARVMTILRKGYE